MELVAIGEILATFWTIWAIAVCCGIAFWALRPANRARFERDALIPLKDER